MFEMTLLLIATVTLGMIINEFTTIIRDDRQEGNASSFF